MYGYRYSYSSPGTRMMYLPVVPYVASCIIYTVQRHRGGGRERGVLVHVTHEYSCTHNIYLILLTSLNRNYVNYRTYVLWFVCLVKYRQRSGPANSPTTCLSRGRSHGWWFRLQVRYVKAAGRLDLEAAVRGSQVRTLTRLSYRHLQ